MWMLYKCVAQYVKQSSYRITNYTYKAHVFRVTSEANLADFLMDTSSTRQKLKVVTALDVT